MPAMRSLMVLIALRAIGISAKRRRFAGVGLGMTPARASVGAPGVRMEGSGTVLRAEPPIVSEVVALKDSAPGTSAVGRGRSKDKGPATRRNAPRKASRMFIGSPKRSAERLRNDENYWLMYSLRRQAGRRTVG